MQLDPEDIDAFFERGWIVKRALFSKQEVARMLKCFETLEQTAMSLKETGLHAGAHFVLGENNGQRVVKRVVWAGGCQDYLLDIGADRRLTVPCSQLLGSASLEQLLSQAHFKRPRDGVVFDWHQDIQHRDKGHGTWVDVNGRGSFVQTLIALDPMTEDGGPLQFIPGSPAWGAVDFGDHDYDDADSSGIRPPQFNDDDAVTVLAEPGDTLLFGPYTVHASFENRSDQYRRVFINGYAYPGANRRVYPGRGAGRQITL